MRWQQHIRVDPAICKGRACIAGTRVMVSSVLDNLADGLSADEIVRSYLDFKGARVWARVALFLAD